jgi:hypothetical protein
MDAPEREYAYRPKWTTVIFITLFFTLAASVLAAKASRNQVGLDFKGLFELEAEGATVFYWGLCSLSLVFVAVGAILTYHRLSLRQRIALGPTSLIVPASRWSGDEVEIAYGHIRTLSLEKAGRQRYLFVHHPGGIHAIVEWLLPSRAAFDEICHLLVDELEANRAQRLG